MNKRILISIICMIVFMLVCRLIAEALPEKALFFAGFASGGIYSLLDRKFFKG